MADRLDFQSTLEELLDSRNVYYQPPESIKIEYDAIVYSKKNITSVYANNNKYSMMDCFEVIVIAKRPDHPVIKKLLTLPYSSYDRHYVADNLHHDVITIYF